jgi:hypothetical protein
MVPSSVAEHFLEDYDGNVLSWPRPAGTSGALQTDRVLFGQGDNAVEVAVASTAQAGQPKADDLRTIFKKRQAGRATPVTLVVFYETPQVGAPSQAHVPRNGPADTGRRWCSSTSSPLASIPASTSRSCCPFPKG